MNKNFKKFVFILIFAFLFLTVYWFNYENFTTQFSAYYFIVLLFFYITIGTLQFSISDKINYSFITIPIFVSFLILGPLATFCIVLLGSIMYKYLYFKIKSSMGFYVKASFISNSIWNTLFLRSFEMLTMILIISNFFKSLTNTINSSDHYLVLLIGIGFFLTNFSAILLIRKNIHIDYNFILIFFLIIFGFFYGYNIFINIKNNFHFLAFVLLITITGLQLILFLLSNNSLKIQFNNRIISLLNAIKSDGIKAENSEIFLKSVDSILQKSEIFNGYVFFSEQYGKREIIYSTANIDILEDILKKHSITFIKKRYFEGYEAEYFTSFGNKQYYFLFNISSHFFNLENNIKNIALDILSLYELINMQRELKNEMSKLKSNNENYQHIINDINDAIEHLMVDNGNSLSGIYFITGKILNREKISVEIYKNRIIKYYLFSTLNNVRLEYIKSIIDNEMINLSPKKINITRSISLIAKGFSQKISLPRKAIIFNINESLFIFIMYFIISNIIKYGGIVKKIKTVLKDGILKIFIYNNVMDNITILYKNKSLDSHIFKKLLFSSYFDTLDIRFIKE